MLLVHKQQFCHKCGNHRWICANTLTQFQWVSIRPCKFGKKQTTTHKVSILFFLNIFFIFILWRSSHCLEGLWILVCFLLYEKCYISEYLFNSVNHETNWMKGLMTAASWIFFIINTVNGGLYHVSLCEAGSWMVLKKKSKNKNKLCSWIRSKKMYCRVHN